MCLRFYNHYFIYVIHSYNTMTKRRRLRSSKTKAKRSRRKIRTIHRGGSFNWKRPFHSLKKSIYKRVWKSRYDKMHNDKINLEHKLQMDALKLLPTAISSPKPGTKKTNSPRKSPRRKTINSSKRSPAISSPRTSLKINPYLR